ncbi:MAG TPA: OsmC family protein [Acetobacteraceae bacterium]|nr:OsmC family protein [Acetobacteraceae bacterium]
MNAEDLRAIQAPLKQRYREDPASARVPARAEGILDPDGVACTVRAWHGEVTAGLHPAGGGTGELACSADMLLEAVVACAGVTLRAVATAMGVTVHSGRIIAEGVWDARGTLGVDRAAPIGLTEITLRFDVDCDADAARLERMIQTTERYCVILQTLRAPPTISVAGGAG